MVKIKYDGVVEAVHYKSDGKLDWVRVYLRMGAVFTDRVLLNRKDFIDQLKAGKRFVVGERILNLGGVFNITTQVHLAEHDHNPVIVVGDKQGTEDDLAGIPVI